AEEEAKEKARLEAEALAKRNAEQNAAEKARLEAEALAKKRAEEEAKEKARIEAEALAKRNAEQNAAEKARLEAETLAKKRAEEEAKEKARLEAEALAKRNAEQNAAEKARLEALAAANRKAQLEAEEAAKKEALAKSRRDREQRYVSLLAKGEKQFDDQDYTKAKNSYSAALDIKPSESFPKQRISAINDLLNKLAEEKRNSVKSTDDYFNLDADLYGTEVDMSGDDGTFLLTKIEDNSDRREYMELQRYIDSLSSNSKDAQLKDVDFSQLTYQKFEELKDEIGKKLGANDYGRNGSVTSIDLYLNAYQEDRKNESTRASKSTLANYEALDKLQDEYNEINSNLSSRNNGLGAEYEKYKDNNTELMKINSLSHLKTNEQIFAELETFKDKINDEIRAKNITAKDKDAQYQEYIDLRSEKRAELNDKEQLSQKFEIDYLESTAEIIRKKTKAGVEKIETTNKVYRDYEEKVVEVKSEFEETAATKIAKTDKELIDFQDNRIKEVKDDQKRVKQFSEDYNELNDKLAEKKKQLGEVDEASQKKINAEIESVTDMLAENEIDGSKKIDEKNKELEKYISDLDDKKNEISKKNTEDRLTTDTQIEKLTDNLSTQKSDENKDQLALIFPEGVTQKVYQKKNNFGEITAITTRRVVVIGNKGDDYIHKKSKSGNFYFKNGKSISESTWDLETSGKIIQ
ncbi:MAG: hypothetical protein ABF242_00460, partial [Flavobacteriales bacterium]